MEGMDPEEAYNMGFLYLSIGLKNYWSCVPLLGLLEEKKVSRVKTEEDFQSMHQHCLKLFIEDNYDMVVVDNIKTFDEYKVLLKEEIQARIDRDLCN